ncbi:MAG: FtsQ-type POTRA domain-containing protein, partial [Clostridia bacterium]
MEKKIEYKKIRSNTKKNSTQKTKNSLNAKTLKTVTKIAKQVDPTYYNEYSFQSTKTIKDKPLSTSRTSTKEKKKKNRKKIFKVTCVILLVLALIIAVYLLLTLPIFNIAKFSVKGLKQCTSEQIVSATKLDKQTNMFLSLFKNVNKSIEELPYIQKASIKLILPNEICILVKERVCTYFVLDKDKNKFFKVDKDGYILEESTIDKKTDDELLTYGITFNNDVVLGDKVNEIDISKLYIYTNIENEFIKSGINGKITKVNFENSLTTITLNDKLNVVLPNDTNLKYNM